MNIAIINSDSGNISSLKNMLCHLGYDVKICDTPQELLNCKYVFLPGVGSFDDVVANLKKKNFYQFLKNKENFKESFLIGICIGMHVLFETSEEGTRAGLGLLDGKVKKIQSNDFKVPHMGWNDIYGDSFFSNCNYKRYYFAHSYYASCDKSIVVAECKYNQIIPAVVRKNNVCGIQFHPEKSNQNGMILLKEIINNGFV